MPNLSLRVLLLLALLPLTPVARAGNSAESLIESGRAKYESGDVNGAAADFEAAIAKFPNEARAYYARGIVRADKGDADGAIADYTKAIELNPKYPQAYTNRGTVKWRRGDMEGALADFNGAIESNPNVYQAFNARGVVKDALGDRIGARTDYNRALELNPEFVSVYANRAQSYYLSRDWNAALTDLRQAFNQGIRNQDSLRLCAWLIRMRQGERDNANDALSAYLKTREGPPDDWFAKLCGYVLGSIPEKELFTAAGSPEAEPQHWCEIWFYRGMKRLFADDREGAKEDLKKCVDTNVRMASEYLFAQAELKTLEK
jgi:Flp pilus assembly protein TadD